MNPELCRVLRWMRRHRFRTALIAGFLIHLVKNVTTCQGVW